MARKAGPEHGADPTPEPGTNPTGDARPVDLSDRPGSKPGESGSPEDPTTLSVVAHSEEVAAVPADPTRAEGAEFPRPDEPADALVTGSADPAEEAPPDRFWESETSQARKEPSTLESGTVGAFGSGDDRSKAPEDRVEGQAGTGPSERFVSSGHPAASSPAPSRRSGVGPLLLGGIVAAAMGFGAAWFAQDRFGGARLPADLGERLATLEARPLPDGSQIEALAGRVSEIETRLAALEEAPAPATAAPVELDPLREEISSGIAQAEERAADLEERLAALEARPEPPAAAAEDPLGSLAASPGPALRTAPSPEASDAGEEAVAALEPRIAAVEAGLAESREALSATDAALASLDERVDSNEAVLSELDIRFEENVTRLDDTETRLGQSETRLDETEARLGTAETRLSDVEATGAAAVEEARAAAGALTEARDRAAAAEAEARREAAIAALDSALDAGEPFEAALPALEGEAPEALIRAASQGVASLATLREAFPDAARDGLAAARSAGLLDEGGVTGFLFNQLSVRSTAPREGDDVDAVLSRAEAALARGRLAEAFAEVENLPEPVRAAMGGWIAQARARVEVEQALQTLRTAEPVAVRAD